MLEHSPKVRLHRAMEMATSGPFRGLPSRKISSKLRWDLR